MPHTALRVEPDGTLQVNRHCAEDTVELETALDTFADRTTARTSQPGFRLTEASFWRARRQGLSLNDIFKTLEMHSDGAIPDQLRSNLERWNQQIERLTLEVDQDRLVLCSSNPLAITAVMRHRTLSDFVIQKLDPTRVELNVTAYPELIATFDACRYPLMDHVPAGWTAGVVPPPNTSLPGPQDGEASAQAVKATARRAVRVPRPLRLSRPCQATTKAGRPCKNRARPGLTFCHVHAKTITGESPEEAYIPNLRLARYMLPGRRSTSLMTLPQLTAARVILIVGMGFGAWLLYLLLKAIGVNWLHLPLPPWVVASLAVVLVSVLHGRLVGRIDVVASLQLFGLTVLTILLDCTHKEGVILNLCLVGLPIGVPLWVMHHYDLSLGWGFLMFPFGLVLGGLAYVLLDQNST